MGTYHRKRKSEKKYHRYQKTLQPGGCQFCAFTKATDQVVDTTRYFWNVKNIFGYDVWDDARVVDHLMIVPKRHVHWLAELTDEEAKLYVKLLQKYEKAGFNMYARTHHSTVKSVPHQHTHLIKTDTKELHLLLYSKKPRFTWFK